MERMGTYHSAVDDAEPQAGHLNKILAKNLEAWHVVTQRKLSGQGKRNYFL